MAKRTKKPYWWHVVADGWSNGAPINAGVTNVGVDIVIPLVDTEEAAALENDLVPEHDEFVVERLIGQWQLRGEQVAPSNYFVHERVYVTQSTAGTVALRDLVAAGEADTSFLYHNVTLWSASFNNDVWGNWQVGGVGDATPPEANVAQHGPLFRDIRVGRRLEEGEALVYHWQLRGTVAPGDAEFSVKCWFRTLVRQG